MIAYIMTWLRGFGKPQPEEALPSFIASTSTKKRGRPKQSQSAATKNVRKKKSK